MIHENQIAKACGGICCTQVNGLSVTLGGTSILENVSFHIHCGEITALIGPNGAGKTTLFHAMLGLVPYTGAVSFENAQGGPMRKPQIGYVPQALDFDRLAPISVYDLFSACVFSHPTVLPQKPLYRKKIQENLAQLGAGELIDRRVGALSGGELQRVLLSIALCPMPDLLLLDEPVSGMDTAGLRSFYETVDYIRQNYDISIILVSHDFNMVRRYANRVILLNRRVLAIGTAEEVLASPEAKSLFSGAAHTEVRAE